MPTTSSVGVCRSCQYPLEILVDGESSQRVRCTVCGDLYNIARKTPLQEIQQGRMNCREPGCKGGVIFTANPILARVNRAGVQVLAYACNSCGRIYADDGTSLYTYDSKLVFIKGTQGILKNSAGEVVGEFSFYPIDTNQVSKQLSRVCESGKTKR